MNKKTITQLTETILVCAYVGILVFSFLAGKQYGTQTFLQGMEKLMQKNESWLMMQQQCFQTQGFTTEESKKLILLELQEKQNLRLMKWYK